MVNPTYGQYSQYVSQYGSGAAGVDNYAQQVLAANPNATLGDFYSGYVGGTGNPANTPGLAALQSQYPDAYNNLLANAGVDANTPLSSLVGPSSLAQDTVTGAPLDSSAGLAAGPSSYVNPDNLNALDPSNTGNQLSGAALDANGLPLQSQTAAPASSSSSSSGCTAANAILGTLTFGMAGSGCSVGQAITTSATAFLQGIESWFTRGFLILLGIVLAAIAILTMFTKSGFKLIHYAEGGN